jgi:hypothetical protein
MKNTLPPPHIVGAETPNQQPIDWRGDHLIEKPDVEWVLATDFPITVDELWDGHRGITRIGPSDEGYAGYMLPSRLSGLVEGTKLGYLLPPPAEEDSTILPKQLEVGASIKDGNGSEKLTVVELDKDTKQMTFEAKWYETADRPVLHYTWEVHAVEGDRPNTSQLLTRMRIAGLEHPKLWEKAGPAADRLTMSLVREGMTGERTPILNRNQKLGAAAILGLGILGSVVAKKLHR